MPKLQIHLNVTMDGGQHYQVVADQRDYARLEVQPFAEVGLHTRIRFFAWSVMTREGKTTATWDDFNLTHCVEVESVYDDDDDESEGEQGLDPGPTTPDAGS
jgi:hypothetical protein